MKYQRCQHPHFVKNGSVKEKQRYKCKRCNYQWTEHHTHRGRPSAERALAVFLYYHGLSMNAIAKMFHTAPSTILQWIRNFSSKHAQLAEPHTDAVVFELDEIWHYVKKQKLWIWKTFCPNTGELIAWECGHRDKATLKNFSNDWKNGE